ncbi:MAG: DUF3127 domain-containing protein [Kiritimatiellia bacterium]|nr:DUF3127 domain-containing protein [Kiritimatiellia bacterium]MDP6847525.1 DUF3127 domain-containing protein [Kiritimatiellia bacterium]
MASQKYEITGKVKVVMDQQTFPSGFTKREFVLTTEEDYPQDVKFECIKDRCSMLDGVNVGDQLTVSFNIRGNEYNERYYVNLQAWRIATATAEDNQAGGSTEDQIVPASDLEDLEEVDEIPF